MIGYLVTAPDIAVRMPVYFSQIQDVRLAAARPRFSFAGIRTPNGQPVLRLGTSGRRLLVYTRSRVYYLRRNKLRLWRRL